VAFVFGDNMISIETLLRLKQALLAQDSTLQAAVKAGCSQWTARCYRRVWEASGAIPAAPVRHYKDGRVAHITNIGAYRRRAALPAGEDRMRREWLAKVAA
jgi:hypothetical protein